MGTWKGSTDIRDHLCHYHHNLTMLQLEQKIRFVHREIVII